MLPPVQFGLIASATPRVGGRVRYMGYVADETGGADASMILYDGVNATGARVVDYIRLASKGNKSVWYGPQGILCEQGIYMDTITGAISGVIFYVPEYLIASAVLVDASGSERDVKLYVTQHDIDTYFAGDN